MPNLKDLRTRIDSVKSTKKITSAMKMVAASKLRRSQQQAEAARPYATQIEAIMQSVASRVELEEMSDASPLLMGTGRTEVQLIVIFTSNRGLCGGFNSHIIRETRQLVARLEADKKKPKLYIIGKKGYDQLRREFEDIIVDHADTHDTGRPNFQDAQSVVRDLMALFEKQEFDVASVLYNKFRSALTQEVTLEQVIPVPILEEAPEGTSGSDSENQTTTITPTLPMVPGGYEFEPSEEEILETLLPRNLTVQLYKALLESSASEHGARMTAMDNATRNAGDMIADLTLTYNRERQAYITKEIIEIVSGAEALADAA